MPVWLELLAQGSDFRQESATLRPVIEQQSLPPRAVYRIARNVSQPNALLKAERDDSKGEISARQDIENEGISEEDSAFLLDKAQGDCRVRERLSPL
jgi:hypothetical protein